MPPTLDFEARVVLRPEALGLPPVASDSDLDEALAKGCTCFAINSCALDTMQGQRDLPLCMV